MNDANMEVPTYDLSKGDSCVELPILRYSKEGIQKHHDKIIQELRMSIVLDGRQIYAPTCSPWDIEELTVGYLYLSGAITNKAQINTLKVDELAGIVEVALKKDFGVESADKTGLSKTVEYPDKSTPTQSKSGADLPIIESELKVSTSEVNTIAAMLESNSVLFRRTGGVHSAALIENASIVAWFEDIGRHSAADKLVGWCVLNDYQTRNCVLLFSGRVPYEIIMKVIKLGCPIIISPGAPTNLSIDLAEQHGVTIIGFAKRGQFNVYSHFERVAT